MIQSRLDRGLEVWPLRSYSDFIEKIRDSEWNSFGIPELVTIQGLYDRFFGRGEFVLGYVPNIITKEECQAAVIALDALSEYIREKLDRENKQT